MSAKPSPHMSYYISQPSFIALMCDTQITGENCLEGWDDTAGSNAGYHNTQLEGWQRKRHLSTQQRHLSTHAMYISMQRCTFTITTAPDIKTESKDILGANWNRWSLRWKKQSTTAVIAMPTHPHTLLCHWSLLLGTVGKHVHRMLSVKYMFRKEKVKGIVHPKNVYSPWCFSKLIFFCGMQEKIFRGII